LIQLSDKTEEAFTAEDEAILLQLAQLLASASEVDRLAKAEQQARQIAETLRVANLSLTQNLHLDDVLETLLDYLGWLVPYDSASVMLRENEATLSFRAIRSYRRGGGEALPTQRIIAAQTNPILYALLTTGKSILLADTNAPPGTGRAQEMDATRRSWLGVPLVSDAQVIGLYSVEKDEPGFFTDDHVRLAEALATQAVVAIENARLFDALRSSEERYRAATELASDYAYAFRVNADGELTREWVTEAFTRITGFTPDEIATQGGWLNLVYAEDLPIARQHMQALFSNQASVSEFRIVTKSGEARWVRDHSRPVWDAAQERATYIYGAAQDITARKEAEEALKRRAAELEALAEVSSALRAARAVEEMMPIFLQKSIAVVNGALGAIFLTEPESGDMVARGWFPPHPELLGARHPAHEGVTGHVAQTGEMHISYDPLNDPLSRPLQGERDLWGKMGVSISVPLRTQNDVVGVMHLGLSQAHRLTEAEMRLLTAIAEMAGNSLHRAILHEQTEQRLQRLAALRAIDSAISTSFDLNFTLNVLLQQVVTQLRVDATAVLLFNPRTGVLEFAAGKGFRTEAINRSAFELGEGYAGRVAQERLTTFVADLRLVATDPSDTRGMQLAAENFVSYMGMPLIAGGDLRGVLEVFQRAPLRADAEWMDFLATLAGQAAIAVDNASLFESLQRSNTELKQAYDATIEGWSRALDLRDEGTHGHSQRVTDMTMRLARAMAIEGETLNYMRWGALLHDIGKMGIPDHILHKPGPLTDEEAATMRHHPVYAYEMLWPIAFLRSALDIPVSHHEKWDGTGYPHGLKGEQIPLAARIFAVVDVWDALRSDRPYRKGWPEEKVRAHIRGLAGSHFDPQVVEIFEMMTT